MQSKKALQGLHLRVMTRARFLDYQFLRFQVGQLVEHYINPYEPPVWLFHLRGYGPTREAALAMAGLPSNIRLSEEIH
jgi:hypothetical protein